MTDIETPPLPSRSSPRAGKKTKQPRHVAFSEVSGCSSVPSSNPRKSKLCRKCNCGSCCFACCACSCLVVLALILGILILGVWFVSFIKSALPEVRVQRVSFPGLRIANSTKRESLLVTSVEVLLNLTNKNEKIGISYSPIDAEVYLDDIKTGQAHVSGFFQEPKNQKTLKLATQVTRTVISKDDGQDLQSDYKDGVMGIDMILNGKVGLKVGKLKLKGLPFVIGCNDIKQADVDMGLMPRCHIRIFAFK